MNRNLIWLIVVVVAFLVAFIPMYIQVQSARSEAALCREQVALLTLRDQIARVYFETTRRNYGTARELSTVFFDSARRKTDETADPQLRQTLQNIMQQRDEVTSGLAQGNPDVLSRIQEIYLSILNATEQGLR
jgi:hypothetical protein